MTVQIILELVAALVALIILHETGHFLACRLFKVEVEEFGIGFPPTIFTMFTAGGTRFTLNWLPLGGFVRPKGENDPSVEGGLAAANPWVRIGVFISGPLMNILAAVLLYAFIYMRIGAPDLSRLNQVEIYAVEPGSPAAVAGLLSGDILLKAGGEVVDSTDKLHDLVYANLGQAMVVELQRGDQVLTVSLTPRQDPPPNQGPMGIQMGVPLKSLSLVDALPEGVYATYKHAGMLFSLVGDAIRGQAPDGGRLVGYKGMYDIYEDIRETEEQEATELGYPPEVDILGFFASITISLGLLNLLPIPGLDGGRILFALPEILFRRRIPPQYENVINAVSIMLLLLVLIFVNLQDFINPVRMP